MFLENKYTRWYRTIINGAKASHRKRGDGNYYESHHIVPKSMGGVETVLLTAKEHFICHLLLCRMTEGANRMKMINAMIKMAFAKSDGQKRHAARSFSLVRAFIAEKNRYMFKGVRKSEETKRRMREGGTGKWIRTEEHNRRTSEAYKGRSVAWTRDKNSEEYREICRKLSEKNKNRDHHTPKIIAGRIRMRDTLRNKRWFKNEITCVFTETCPPGFVPGRLPRKKKGE